MVLLKFREPLDLEESLREEWGKTGLHLVFGLIASYSWWVRGGVGQSTYAERGNSGSSFPVLFGVGRV